MLDLGCSVGLGTMARGDWLLRRPGAAADRLQLEGLDRSAEMLAVARVREAEHRSEAHASVASSPAITWHHAATEATGLAASAHDLITLQFLCHELPQAATQAVLVEAARLLRPDGVIAVVDQDPDSEAIRRLPALSAILHKSTEPCLEDDTRLDVPAALQAAGFHRVCCEAADPRHGVLVALR